MNEFETRKINGARLFDLINQSVTNALLINILALLVAFTLLQLIQKPLHEIFYNSILPPFEIGIETFLIFGCIFIFGILITGVYPIAFSGLNKRSTNRLQKNGMIFSLLHCPYWGTLDLNSIPPFQIWVSRLGIMQICQWRSLERL
jgi:Na+-driven multidrug efflux pump